MQKEEYCFATQKTILRKTFHNSSGVEEMGKDFSKMVECIKKKWGFIPTLKGRQAQYNILAFKVLTEAAEASTWDLAKEYLEMTGKWDLLDPNGQIVERMKKSTVFYRRMKNLLEKKYVDKDGSHFKLTVKGLLLALALFPETFHSSYMQESLLRIIGRNVNKDFPIMIRDFLFKWKINLDEMPEKDVRQLLKQIKR